MSTMFAEKRVIFLLMDGPGMERAGTALSDYGGERDTPPRPMGSPPLRWEGSR